MAAEFILKKGKRGTAAYIQSAYDIKISNEIFDIILNPTKGIDDWDTIEWCQWLLAGGRTPEEFSQTVKKYDSAASCGLVWITNFVAYRCRTCGISPCMSLCSDCFQQGNHEGHDFNMFRSQAGGACDCGDKSVMREFGFCQRHGPQNQSNKTDVPPDLLLLAQLLMPRLFLRLIQHLRDTSTSENSDKAFTIMQAADSFITMLHNYSSMGAAMHRVMTHALTDTKSYTELALVCDSTNPEKATYLKTSLQIYTDAKILLDHSLRAITCNNAVTPDDPPWCPDHDLQHSSFLDELVFWTIKYEFPQKLVCLLLNMMPDLGYKEAFTKTFVHHYHRISKMLSSSSDSDTLSNRVVHVSVQLFSNEDLALKMTRECALLHIMVHSLYEMMLGIAQPSILQFEERNSHLVVDCSNRIMKDHCYWFLVSDLNNVLTHEAVAFEFLSDISLLRSWFSFLSLFQGMNVNQRELKLHVEFETNTYYAAFSAELEASATPMWAQISHLKDNETVNKTRSLISECLRALNTWFNAIGFSLDVDINAYQVSFHLPLHRSFACYLGQAVRNQGAPLLELLPSQHMLKLMMMHPLQAMVSFNEILCGMWVRSGLQMKGQAMTYIQCHFCNSIVDADLFLLQLCCAHLDPDWFLKTVLQRFHVWEWFSFHPLSMNAFLESEQVMPMLEGALSFLCTLMVTRTNIGLSDTEVTRQEMVSLLCMSDRTHSQLMDLLPDKCGASSHTRDFEEILREVAEYKAPTFEVSGTMVQGTYVPKPAVWENEYDPIHILLRACHRREYQSSLDRYATYLRQSGNFSSSKSPWPPYRIPKPVDKAFQDPRGVLHSKTMQGIIFIILHRAVHNPDIPEQVLSLCIYLLDMAIRFPCNTADQAEGVDCDEAPDLNFEKWFASKDILSNVTSCIRNVKLSDKQESRFQMVEEMEVDEEMEVLDENEMDLGQSSSEMLYDVQSPIVEEDFHEIIGQQLLPPIGQQLALLDGSFNTSTELVPVSQQSGSEGSELIPMVVPTPTFTSASMGATLVPLPSTSSDQNMALVPTSEGMTAVRPRRFKLKEVPGKYCTLLTDNELVPNGKKHFNNRREMDINESILSLLLKLHSKVSEKSDSYRTTNERNAPPAGDNDSRIGDGAMFVERIVDRIAQSGENRLQAVEHLRHKLWPKKSEVSDVQAEHVKKEERRRRAKERQQKLMAEFASRQKAFLQKNMETDFKDNASDAEKPDTMLCSEEEYDCVICGQTAASEENRPMGMVVLLQATSVLGHRTENGIRNLPCGEDETFLLQKDKTYASIANARVELLTRHFDNKHWQMAVNIGWEGGVHVQSCGHYLHIDCHKSYVQSLKCQNQLSSRLQNLAVDRGEYSCPLCRQLANSVIPLNPHRGRAASLVRSHKNNMHDMASELSNLMGIELTEVESNMLKKYMGGIMEDLTNATYPQYRALCSPNSSSLYLFVCSILRTNLEIELVQRGGNLSSHSKKKTCFGPLLHMLSMHSRLLTQAFPYKVWTRLTGHAYPDDISSLCVLDDEIPILLRDCIALLLQIVLTLPLNLDKAYYNCVIQVLYNILYIQAMTQLCCNLSKCQREYWKNKGSAIPLESMGDRPRDQLDLTHLMVQMINLFEQSCLYVADDELDPKLRGQLSLDGISTFVKENSLHFLRIASLLQSHLYDETPVEVKEEDEYGSLCQYLGLSPVSADPGSVSPGASLHWATDDPFNVVIKTWCLDYTNFASKSVIAARSLLQRPVSWGLPSLLRLPRKYDEIFQCYYKRQCTLCHREPKDPSVCLICGTLVCLREICCRQQMHYEAVLHSVKCGAGTAMYLAVNSSTIIVIRGKRACLWGSVYLDSYGEEDRDLKRGKPLFLNMERYSLLQDQWRHHSFDHTNKRWVWHKDNL